MVRIILLSFLFSGISLTLFSQEDSKIYTLGQDDSALLQDHNQLLVAVCDYDIDKAFTAWMSMMTAIEEFAEVTEFEKLNGTKMWIKVLWDENGGIDHLGYFLQPDSRYVPEEELSTFLEAFIETYVMDITSTSKYHHYGKISFPTFYVTESEEEVVENDN